MVWPNAAKGELELDMGDCIGGKGQVMIQGIYEEGIDEICEIFHDSGGRVYMDGTNVNACRVAETTVAELKRALEKSEDSIGSLELKLEWLKARKGVCNSVDYGSTIRNPFLRLFRKSKGSNSRTN
ncbi:hypothetical protein Nepgr_030532 [Nepenthes gracilis]|uniref:Uncharacterized protein n=1 Tax=Nepenthes gracilis TaxID=150966 RepID=A0AAD3TGA9_NEPGR|nr:hypothetical protein Nepgr_030532 [Nepenthes gracilis]